MTQFKVYNLPISDRAVQTVLTRGGTEALLRRHTAPGSEQRAVPPASACSACAQFLSPTLTNWFCRILQLEQHHIYKCHRFRIKSSSAHTRLIFLNLPESDQFARSMFEAMNINEGGVPSLTKNGQPPNTQPLRCPACTSLKTRSAKLLSPASSQQEGEGHAHHAGQSSGAVATGFTIPKAPGLQTT